MGVRFFRSSSFVIALCKVYANLRLIWFDSDIRNKQKNDPHRLVKSREIFIIRPSSSSTLKISFSKNIFIRFSYTELRGGKVAIFMKKAKHLICKSLFFSSFDSVFFSLDERPNQIYSISNFISNIFRNWFNGFYRNAEEPTSKKKGNLIAANSPHRRHHHHHRHIFIYEIA